ncbi:hypothetical protein SAMN05216238_11158 [Lentibacillus persicus]|uniref:Uncharacterized protein n=1 Tax=Lentibacillus persicus TaxID=640948 RepID=A0A1I1Z0P1_9BACI|nr:CBO0543 family protein [Lentibacillus persicus]SFE25289.1 hypothetical protein SAMN05216238_11158 [Lentibacillus persicus]
MEIILWWIAFFIGIVLLWFSLRKLPFKEWILVYLLTSYFSIILGTIVVEENMLHYPEKVLDKHFESSILFEYLMLPAANIYFYYTTYQSKLPGMLIQSLIYSSLLTMIEVPLEKYTDLIEYHTWTWMYTFISLFLFFIFIRILMQLINKAGACAVSRGK